MSALKSKHRKKHMRAHAKYRIQYQEIWKLLLFDVCPQSKPHNLQFKANVFLIILKF